MTAANMPEDHPRRCQGNRHKRHWADPNVPEQCGQYALTDSKYCKFHGGHQARSVALRKNFRARSTFLTGLPKGLAKRIEHAAADPELTSLRTHIALVDDRIQQILAKLPTKESGQAWQALQEDHAELEAQYAALKRAIPPELDVPALKDALKRIDKCVELMFKNFRRTRAEREIWSEALGHFEQRRRMAETEVKRENYLQANLTQRQTITLFAAITAIIKEELRELPVPMQRIGARLSTLIANEPGRPSIGPPPRGTADDAEYEILPREAAAESGSSAEVSGEP